MGGIPSNYTVDVSLDMVNPVDLAGIPTGYGIDIKSLPKIQIGLDAITVNPLTVNPLELSVRVKEAPSIRAHVPANFTVGFSVLGFQLGCIRLCGEAQVITEPYVPNPCEPCGAVAIPLPAPAPTPAPTPAPIQVRGDEVKAAKEEVKAAAGPGKARAARKR